MLNWRSGFTRQILQRGNDCRKNHAVWGLNRGPSSWEAVVVGTEMYPVEIAFNQDGITDAAVLLSMERRWPESLQDRDDKLAKKLDSYSSDEIDLALKFSIDVLSMHCTALLLNRSKGEERFSPDEFTLDDLPEEYGQNKNQEQQGDNDPLLFLYPDAPEERRREIREKYGLISSYSSRFRS